MRLSTSYISNDLIGVKSLVLFFLVYTLISFCNLSAQDRLTRQLEYANNLYESDLYFDAVTEYKRLVFFDRFGEHTGYANYKIGMCYKYGGKYDIAITFLKKAELASRNVEDIYDAKIQIIRCNILRRSIDTALILLDDLEKDTRFTTRKDDIIYWRGWAYMLADNWPLAAETFLKLGYDHPLRKLSNQVENAKYSVTFAKVISYILPGSGQFYSGHYLSGLMSLGWNVWMGYLTINSFLEDRAFDGLVIGNLLWLRFYRGNAENAEKFAVSENIEIANEAYQFLKNDFMGDKP